LTKVGERLARLDADRATVTAQLTDLETAERVLMRVSKTPPARRTRSATATAAAKAPDASLGKLPPKVSYDLRRLRTDIEVTGRCSLVLVATQHPLPPDLNSLLREDREGKTLEPVLDRLAGHLIPLGAIRDGRPPVVTKPSAVIRRLQYSAV
jgi:hypothetical protein